VTPTPQAFQEFWDPGRVFSPALRAAKLDSIDARKVAISDISQ
jgi:hypothetical protein